MRVAIIITAAVIIFLVSCSHGHDHAHDHDHHHHDDVKLFLWGYSESFEVFAEADPFSTGSNAVMLIHITRLSDFRPLESGTVTASLVSGNRGIRQALPAPERPGIYRFILQPEFTGEARLLITIETDDTEEIVDTGLLTVYDDAHAAIHGAEDLFPDIPGAVVFTKEQSWAVEFATDEASAQAFGPVIKTVGEVMPDRADELIMNARTSGVVQFSVSDLYPGLPVAANQPLLSITGGELAEGNAALRYQEARNNYTRAKADYERLTALHEDKIISQREWLQAGNAYQNAAALYHNLRAHFTESGQILLSPWIGYIRDILVAEGEFVELGQPIMRLARDRKLVVRTHVQQHQAAHLARISELNIGFNNQTPVSLSALQGSVISVGRSLDPATGMIPVHIRINYEAPGFLPGTLVDVYIKTETEEKVLAIPNTALIEEQGNFFVFTQNHPESFSKRQVRVGQSDGIMTHIAGGLTEHERIVTRGAVMVKLAAAAGDLDPHSGHVH